MTRVSDFALRSVHVIAGLDPAHGGPSYTVPRLCQAMAVLGAEAGLLSVGGIHGRNTARDEECGRSFAPDWAGIPLVR